MAASRPIKSIVETILSRDLSPRARQIMAADFARARLGEGIEQNRRATGRLIPYEQIVDGRRGAALESVNPENGRIIFMFDVGREQIFAFIAEQLVRHAPRLTGRFSDSFKLYAGGREVASKTELPRADEYVFLNTQPYARRLEGGWSNQAPSPPGIFHAVAALAKQRYGDVAAIRFSFRSYQEFGLADYVPSGRRGAIVRGERGRFAKGSAPRNDDRADEARRERATRTPAIIVRLG